MPGPQESRENGRANRTTCARDVDDARDLRPDADLLALCASLAVMQAEWQRLHRAALDGGPGGPADRAWKDYSDRAWPGIRLSARDDPTLHSDDVPGRLRSFRAVTVEGKIAKASALLALEKAVPCCGCRDDACLLAFSLLQDAAEAGWLQADR